MMIKKYKTRRNEPTQWILPGPRGPARNAPQARRFYLITFSRSALIAGGTPAVPANRLTLISGKEKGGSREPPLSMQSRFRWLLFLYSHLPKHVSVVKRHLVQIIVPAGRAAVTGAHIHLK